MRATEDIFTPIHKAIRSMIYDVGGRLQTNDFADLDASKPLLADLEHEFSDALSSGCLLCILHHHATDEELSVFPSVSSHGPELVQSLIQEHHDLARQLGSITTHSRALAQLSTTNQRIEAGSALNREVNTFFADYIEHMNREEVELVPLMQERFTNEQMRAMRATIIAGMPPDRVAAIFRWMLPSLNVTELTDLVGGVKAGAPPAFLALLTRIGEERVDPARWRTVKARVGI